MRRDEATIQADASALRVLADADQIEQEGGLQLRVGHVGLLEAQRRRAHEPLEFGWLPGERLSHKSHLVHLPLPLLFLALARFHHLENLRVNDETMDWQTVAGGGGWGERAGDAA